MNLRCVFHVSPAANSEPKSEHQRMPSIDIQVEAIDEARPRGRSFETWARARGWVSED